MKPIYIVAEAGVNHNGSRAMAFQLVDAAVKAGAGLLEVKAVIVGVNLLAVGVEHVYWARALV